LRRYRLEISQFEPLTAEEEQVLIRRYQQEGDQEAAYRLVTSNLNLVVKIAFIYRRVYNNVMDLIQEGNIGLIQALGRFDPDRGTRLPTYASWWIKAYIIKFIMDNFRIVRIGTTNQRRKLLFNLRKEKEKLRLQGIEPTSSLIAKKLDVPVKEVREVQHAIESSDLSLDNYIDPNRTIRHADTLEATGELVEETLARGELKRLFAHKFREFAETLNEREQAILNERLIAEEPKTLQQLGTRFGVSREAIRLNQITLTKKIKAYMQEALKDVTDVEFALIS
ncbi:MAG: sigma-70 family RNA polymerase sigma factor, partial [Candidatus Aminicenantes bacterium]|nr:sigma-70 family RNA polymerase sigma factor [Candidatus Aminicenantes bacterium]